MQLPLNLPQSVRINTNIQTVVRQFVTNITSNPACRFNFFHQSIFLLSILISSFFVLRSSFFVLRSSFFVLRSSFFPTSIFDPRQSMFIRGQSFIFIHVHSQPMFSFCSAPIPLVKLFSNPAFSIGEKWLTIFVYSVKIAGYKTSSFIDNCIKKRPDRQAGPPSRLNRLMIMHR